MEDDKEKKTESWPNHGWAELTQLCLINILSRLPIEDRWRGAMFVCKPWLEACKDPNLNSVIDLETQFESATESSRFWTPEFERKMDSMLRSVVLWSDGSLTTVRVRHCSDQSLALIAERSPNLQVLSIKCCPHVTDETMFKIASGCRLLRELDISLCYQISHNSLALIGQHCANLRILRRNFTSRLDLSQQQLFVPGVYLDAYPQDGDSEASAIGKFMLKLVQLELRFSDLTNKGLALICEGCVNLEHLDLSGCTDVTSSDISNASSNLKQLKTLKKPQFYFSMLGSHTERYIWALAAV
uniref:F-box protein SKIP1-like n=1 Tax=Nicotiana sylvestris TaxID=4096 RepID=A0A1U7YBT7_NICSY|nr:PREDICTED: F-box protein SKIP1-like [Nicotiana sylvestris]